MPPKRVDASLVVRCPRTRFRGVRGIWQVDPRDNRKTTVAMNRDAFPDKSVEIGLKNVLKDKGIFPADW